MRKICAKLVPRNLREQQRDAWLSAIFNIQIHYGDAAAFFFLFQKVKSEVKGHHFESTEDIQRSVT
jgi:hypothetical protein